MFFIAHIPQWLHRIHQHSKQADSSPHPNRVFKYCPFIQVSYGSDDKLMGVRGGGEQKEEQ